MTELNTIKDIYDLKTTEKLLRTTIKAAKSQGIDVSHFEKSLEEMEGYILGAKELCRRIFVHIQQQNTNTGSLTTTREENRWNL